MCNISELSWNAVVQQRHSLHGLVTVVKGDEGVALRLLRCKHRHPQVDHIASLDEDSSKPRLVETRGISFYIDCPRVDIRLQPLMNLERPDPADSTFIISQPEGC